MDYNEANTIYKSLLQLLTGERDYPIKQSILDIAFKLEFIKDITLKNYFGQSPQVRVLTLKGLWFMYNHFPSYYMSVYRYCMFHEQSLGNTI